MTTMEEGGHILSILYIFKKGNLVNRKEKLPKDEFRVQDQEMHRFSCSAFYWRNWHAVKAFEIFVKMWQLLQLNELKKIYTDKMH